MKTNQLSKAKKIKEEFEKKFVDVSMTNDLYPFIEAMDIWSFIEQSLIQAREEERKETIKKVQVVLFNSAKLHTLEISEIMDELKKKT